MTAGIEVFGESGALLVSEKSLNSRAVYAVSSKSFDWGEGGYNQHVLLQLPFTYLKDEVPIILIRPSQYDKYVGSCQYSTYFAPLGSSFPDGNGGVSIQGQCQFDMIVFSTKGTPIQRSGNPMFEVYDPSGNITFSDKYLFPRLRKLINRGPTPANQGWPMRTDITSAGIRGMPWFLAGPLFLSGKGMGVLTEQGGSTVMAIASDKKTVMVNYRFDGPAENKALFDPYANRYASFWVADVTGI